MIPLRFMRQGSLGKNRPPTALDKRTVGVISRRAFEAFGRLKGTPSLWTLEWAGPRALSSGRDAGTNSSHASAGFPSRFMLHEPLAVESRNDLGNACSGFRRRLHRRLVLCQLGRAAGAP